MIAVRNKEENHKHTLVQVNYKKATCEQPGTTAYWRCDTCNKYYSDKGATNEIKEGSWIVPATGHNYGEWKVIKNPSCSNEGVEERTCRDCGQKETRLISATNKHVWGQWNVTKEATVLKEGKKARSCSVCGKQDVIRVRKLKPTYKVNASSIKLKVKQSTKKVSITGLAKGDSVKTWSSSNKKIVTVSKKGVIKGKKVGKAIVTALLESGKKITIKVKVQKKAVATTKIGGLSKKVTLKKGGKLTFKPVLYPITSVEKVKYSSSNKKIVTVSSKGVVKAKKAGTGKITVKVGKKKFVVTVKVTE